MYRSLLMKLIAIIIATCLLIFIEYKFEVIDYLRFVNSAKSFKGSLIIYSNDGELIATPHKHTDSPATEKKASKKFQIEIRRTNDRSLITSIDSPTTGNLTFSPDGSMIAAGSHGGKVYVWRTSDGKLLYFFDDSSIYYTTMPSLAFTPDGNNLVGLILTKNSPSRLTVWNLVNKTNRVLSGKFASAALSPDGETIAVGQRNHIIDLYRFDDLSLIKQLDVDRNPISHKFSPNGKKIAFIGYSFKSLPGSISDRHVYLHSVEDGSLLKVFYYSTIFPKSKESLKNFAISPDDRYLAVSYSRSATSDFFVGAPRWSDARYYGMIRVWRVEDGKQLATFRGHKHRTSKLVFSPDGKFLTSTGADGKVRFWRMPPRNYSKFWIFCVVGLAGFVYWRRTYLIGWINR